MKTTIAVFLTLIVLTSSCDFLRKKGLIGKSKAQKQAVSMALQDSIRAADSIKAVEEQMRTQALEQARFDSIRVAEQARLEKEALFKYHIIVGSFLTPEYADDYMKYYRSMGYDAHIIGDSSNRFNLVSAEVHENLRQAIRRLYQYQDTVEFEAWLYINE